MNKKIIIGAATTAAILIIILSMFLGLTRNAFKSIGGTSLSDMASSRSQEKIAYDGSMQNIPSAPQGSGVVSSTDKSSEFETMLFKDYGSNVFIETSKDRLSTFGLDVDTASYSIAKNYIMRGELPPTDAIRPEEFINYFDYQYTNPKEDFGIYSELAPSPFETNLHFLKIGIKSRQEENRKDAILTFVVDTSGSMNRETRIGLVKKTMRYLVDQLREGDEIAIIKYSTTAELVLEHTSVENKQKIFDAIDGLMPTASTNAEAGLKLGYQEAQKGLRKDAINRVILLSDGVANVGNTGADSILNQLENYKKQGITLTAIGVGMGNLNDALLEQLADKGDGNYYYINDFSEAKKVFSAQLTGTLQVIAKDAKIQVDFNPDAVEKYRLIGYENRAIADESFRDDSKDAGEIGMGHEVTAIYEVQLRSKTENLARVYMRYKNPENSIAKEIAQDITPSSIKNSFESGTSRFKMAISAARFAQILKLTSPPPSINKVIEIVNSIEQIDDAEKDFKIVLSNAKGLIEAKQGGN